VVKKKGLKVKPGLFPSSHSACLHHNIFFPGPCERFKTWLEVSILKEHEPEIDFARHDPERVTREVGGVRPNEWYADLVSRPDMYLNSFRDIQVTAPPNTLDSRKRWHVTDSSTNISDSQSDGWNEVVWRFDDDINANTSTERGTGFGFLNSLSINDRIILMARALVCPLFHGKWSLIFIYFTGPRMDRHDFQRQDRNLLRLFVFISVALSRWIFHLPRHR